MSSQSIDKILEQEENDHAHARLGGATTGTQQQQLVVDGQQPHKDEATWYVVPCDRGRAERLLQGKPEGTFLIRPRTGPPESYALSIV